MALSQLINFLAGATRLAKLDPATAFPDEAPEQAHCHRTLVRAGTVGAVVGAIFGVWMSYEMYLHPDQPNPDGRSIMMTFVLAPLMMLAAGILAGVSWAGLFLPATFFSSSIGVHWRVIRWHTGKFNISIRPRATRTGRLDFINLLAAADARR